jgi:hypothetical protein
MGRLGTFVPRLLALTAVWLLATTALTYAAAKRINTPTAPPATTTATTAAAPTMLVVPDVRRTAYVFAKGALSDAGFAWRVEGAVQGYPANTVVSQSPAPGTRLIDTGAPLILLHLQKAPGTPSGIPETVSAIAGTAVRVAGLASAALPTTVAPTTKPKAAVKVAVPKAAVKVAASKRAPVKHLPSQQRPPAFIVPGARREPLDEIPLTARAKELLVWLNSHPNATNANVKHWLYQHAWIVTGAEMGWSQGAQALQTLITADRRVFALWGIGDRSAAVARQALAEVEARSK